MKNEQNDIEIIESKIKKLRKKRRFFLYAGFILLPAGVGLLALKHTAPGIGCIIIGAILRVLYYMISADIKSYKKLKTNLSDKLSILIFCTGIIFVNSLYALQPGDRATELDNLEWLKGEQFKIFDNTNTSPPESKKNLIIIEYWLSSDKDSKLAIPVLVNIQKKHSDSIKIIALSNEKQDTLNTFLASPQGQTINYSVAIDPSKATTKCFIENDQRVPQVFVINSQGQVLWRGHPIELENVIKQIQKGTFDLKKQKKIARLHNTLQSFIQLEDLQQIQATANRILTIAPDDDLALRVKLYAFESQKKLNLALDFLNKHIESHPDIPTLYVLKLDIMNKLNTPLNEINEEMEKIIDKFSDKPSILFQIADIAVNRFALGTAPMIPTLKAANLAVQLQKNSSDKDDLSEASYNSVLAKALYLTGQIAKAIEFQEKTIERLTDPIQKKAASAMLDYYQEAAQAASQPTVIHIR